MRYFLEVAYKGTNYSGFQIQENAISIQSEIEKALQLIQRRRIPLTGSSRTDAGVHALQNYFHFDFDSQLNPHIIYKLNAILPKDIAVREIYGMPLTAHSRFDATSRHYSYYLHNTKNPFKESTSLFYPYKLNKSLLEEGAAFIKTQENFVAFSKTNTQVKNFQCQILHSEWRFGDEEMVYAIQANRFLRGMVRLITGSLLRVGREKMGMKEFKMLFGATIKSGHSVPAHGLFLNNVTYPENYFPLAALRFTDF